jgi:hypothetical protein
MPKFAHQVKNASSHAVRPCLQRRARTTCRAVAVSQPLEQVLSWAEAQKIATDRISVSEDIATSRSVLVAGKDVPAGESFVTVPESAWITPEVAQQSSIGQYLKGLEPWLQLTLLLLAEKGNPGSKIAAYVNSMPSQPNSPLFWSDEQLQMLQGTQLLESVQGYK